LGKGDLAFGGPADGADVVGCIVVGSTVGVDVGCRVAFVGAFVRFVLVVGSTMGVDVVGCRVAFVGACVCFASVGALVGRPVGALVSAVEGIFEGVEVNRLAGVEVVADALPSVRAEVGASSAGPAMGSLVADVVVTAMGTAVRAVEGDEVGRVTGASCSSWPAESCAEVGALSAESSESRFLLWEVTFSKRRFSLDC
jgi:hypothetical protein